MQIYCENIFSQKLAKQTCCAKRLTVFLLVLLYLLIVCITTLYDFITLPFQR